MFAMLLAVDHHSLVNNKQTSSDTTSVTAVLHRPQHMRWTDLTHNVARNDMPGWATFLNRAWVPSKGSSLGNRDSWSTSSWSDSGWDDTSWVPDNQYSRWSPCGGWCPENCTVWTMER